MNFWDTSAFVDALDDRSTSHARASGLLFQKTAQAASVLIHPEAVAAFARKLRPDRSAIARSLSLVETLMHSIELWDVDRAVIERSVALAARGLRGADAIHLATAILMARGAGRRGFVFVTRDLEQAAAARTSGLRVLVP